MCFPPICYRNYFKGTVVALRTVVFSSSDEHVGHHLATPLYLRDTLLYIEG